MHIARVHRSTHTTEVHLRSHWFTVPSLNAINHQSSSFILSFKMPAKKPTSKKRTKAEKKKLRKAQQAVFCWYCEREFEDAKVLLQHQKAKHFRCPNCPRRLNTAGGLAVHIDQVHKLPTDRIENALPGRDTFDVEIYGMEGVPANDLADWKRRKAEAMGVDPETHKRKRPKIFLGVLTSEDLKAQLQQHRALMNGISNTAPVRPPVLPYGVPPPALGGPPSASVPPPGLFTSGSAPMPPPGFPMMPPPGSLPFPPPGMGMPPMPHGLLPPGMPFPPPPGMLPAGMPPPPGMMPLPGIPMNPGTPGLMGNPPPFAPPGGPPPPGVLSTPLAPPPGPPAATPSQAAPAPVVPPTPVQPYKVESSQVTPKAGQLLMYGDTDVSIEEKRARQPRYQAPIAVPDMRLGLSR